MANLFYSVYLYYIYVYTFHTYYSAAPEKTPVDGPPLGKTCFPTLFT